jgi:FAD/FMN-containing dehydrogenase
VSSAYETDWTGRWHGRARSVERPGSTDEVGALLRRCSAAGVPVTIAGGRTGLVGGAVPPEDGSALVLSTERLTRVEPVDGDEGSVVVGAGVTLAALQRLAREEDLEYAVDLAARDSATVGGMVATDAGGLHVPAYGTTRAQVLGLEAVLADGSVVSRLHGLAKEALGTDWAQLLVGSEGTLAVVTAARLRLRPRPRTLCVGIVGVAGVAEALAVLGVARGLPGLRAVEYAEAPVVSRTHVLVEVAGPVELLAPLDPVAAADDAAGRAALWAEREAATETVARLAAERGDPVHKLDVALPLGRLADFRRAVDAVVPGDDLRVWGHLAEGNLHVNLWGDRDAAVLRLVAEHGGVISSEHGVGRAKVDALPLSRTAAEIALLRRLKQALDPQGLLNPGVLLP